MFGINPQCSIAFDEEYHDLESYQGSMPRWCPGCGDNAILTAVQKLCRDEQLPLEKTVFVSGIGCSSRFPHYMKTYGFHGLHGRALPVAQGIKIRRPDLHVFVNMGDGDCCSIGTAHWIHAVRYNMKMVVLLHDNEIYGLTKMQVSPTSPQGLKTNTTPHGSPLQPLNPLSVTLSISNVSFVANAVEWIPEVLNKVISAAFHHNGFSFIRILQRCPHFTPKIFEPIITDPNKLAILTHKNGMQVSEDLAKVYKNQMEHDPSDLHKARELVEMPDQVPIGILYQNKNIMRYEEARKRQRIYSMEMRKNALENEFAKFAIEPLVQGNGK